MAGFFEQAAINATPPGTGGKITISTASSTAGSGNFDAYKGRWIWLKSDVKTYVRAGTSLVGAATAGDMYLTADTDYFWRVPKDGTLSYLRAKGTGSGTLFWRTSSGPV